MRISGIKNVQTMSWTTMSPVLDNMKEADLWNTFAETRYYDCTKDKKVFKQVVEQTKERFNSALKAGDVEAALGSIGISDVVLDTNEDGTLLVVCTDGTEIKAAHIVDGGIVYDNTERLAAIRPLMNNSADWQMFVSPIKMFCSLPSVSEAAKNVNAFLIKERVNHPVAVINYLLYGADSIEKLGSVFAKSLENPELDLAQARKRHQVIGLPQKLLTVLSMFKESAIASECAGALRNGDFEGNDMTEFAALLDAYWRNSMWELKSEKERYDTRMKQYICGVVKICEICGCSLMKTATYLARQALSSMIYVTDDEINKSSTKTNIVSYRGTVTVPDYIAREYNDYLAMGGKPWPDDLFKAKATLDLHSKIVITDEDRRLFREYGEMIEPLYSYEREGYRFVVPKDYDSFMEIGYDFHNCLPVCGKLYYSGHLDIVFVYPPASDVPTAALEIKDWRIVQQVTYRDLPITDPVVLDHLRWYARYLTIKKQNPYAAATAV